MIGRCALRAVHDLDSEGEDGSKGLLGYPKLLALPAPIPLPPQLYPKPLIEEHSHAHSCNLQWLSTFKSVTPVAVDPAGSFGINIASRKSLSIWIASVYNHRSTAFVAEWRQKGSRAQCGPGRKRIAPGPSTATHWGVSKGTL